MIPVVRDSRQAGQVRYKSNSLAWRGNRSWPAPIKPSMPTGTSSSRSISRTSTWVPGFTTAGRASLSTATARNVSPSTASCSAIRVVSAASARLEFRRARSSPTALSMPKERRAVSIPMPASSTWMPMGSMQPSSIRASGCSPAQSRIRASPPRCAGHTTADYCKPGFIGRRLVPLLAQRGEEIV